VSKSMKEAVQRVRRGMVSVNEVLNTLEQLDDLSTKRAIAIEKMAKSRKEAIKGEIVAGGVAAFAAHIRELNAAMPAAYMPQVPTDFGGCIKNLRTVDSIRNAVNSELARAKIAAGEIATRIHANVAAIKESGLVVPDTAALVLKSPDDLAAVLAQRAAAEQAKEEAQRARILAQVQAEAAAKLAGTGYAFEKAYEDCIETGTGIATTGTDLVDAVALPDSLAEVFPAAPAVDTGPRLTLGKINERLAPISLSVDCLSQLGFDPVERVKASRFYLESDLPAIARAIARHVIDATS
jgi:hypothetical protein